MRRRRWRRVSRITRFRFCRVRHTRTTAPATHPTHPHHTTHTPPHYTPPHTPTLPTHHHTLDGDLCCCTHLPTLPTHPLLPFQLLNTGTRNAWRRAAGAHARTAAAAAACYYRRACLRCCCRHACALPHSFTMVALQPARVLCALCYTGADVRTSTAATPPAYHCLAHRGFSGSLLRAVPAATVPHCASAATMPRRLHLAIPVLFTFCSATHGWRAPAPASARAQPTSWLYHLPDITNLSPTACGCAA